MIPKITLKVAKEKPLFARHPWVFSGALQDIQQAASLAPGTIVDIVTSGGKFVARGFVNVHSQITCRALTFQQETIDAKWFEHRIHQAASLREKWLSPRTNAMRLVASESDGLPGLIIDRYADTAVFQILSYGMEVWREAIIAAIANWDGIVQIVERSDEAIRAKEGLGQRKTWVKGDRALVPIQENGITILVDVWDGHKTGFYLDQRENRSIVGSLSEGATLLNCFSYSGGFGLHALANDANHVIQVDQNGPALALAKEAAKLNGFAVERVDYIEADVFDLLRNYRDEGRQFDVIVMDPPKFVAHKGQLEQASRGYKDLNLLAFKLLRPGGHLATFSCSGLLDAKLFQQIIFAAALDAGVSASIVKHLGQDRDHPVSLFVPETFYLKGLLCQRLR